MGHAFRAGVLCVAILHSGCFAPGEGTEPPLDRIYFPVGLALDSGARHLFVVNSDFDLQFNGGSVQSYDLDALRALIPADGTCGALGERPPESQVIVPGRCGHVDPEGSSLIVSAVGIGAFATDVVFQVRPEVETAGPAGRLYIPVRGDTTLHFIDVDESGRLDCGQAGNDGDCDDAHRRGDDPDQENTRGLRLPPEPLGLAASEDGRAIAVTHQTEGAASLFVVRPWESGPRLEFVARNMPTRPTGIVALPIPAAQQDNPDYQPGFLVTFRDAAEVRLLRFFSDEVSSPQRPFLEQAGRADIRTNSTGFDSRGIAIEASRRSAAEEACDESPDPACLQAASAVPLKVFVANRTPASLIFGETRPDGEELPLFWDPVPIDFGPSRVVVGDIVNAQGQREPRVFVVCFDARRVFVYDPVRGYLEANIRTGRGPHALAIDSEHGFAYLGSFTDSYVAVIGIDQTKGQDYGKILLTVGVPTPPRASK